MKKYFVFFIFLVLAIVQNLAAQNKVYRVAIFAPLYLDSVFTNSQLRNDKSIPKFIAPALEFVQGAEIAFDTLSFPDKSLEAFIYDTKSYLQPLSWLIKNKLLDSLDLIIGSVKDLDFKELGEFSAKKNIPFISATYPNDGGITNNPFMTIMNSTLKAHCEGIYSYILQNHGTDKIFLVRKSGQQEDKIAGFIKTLNEQEGKPLLNITTINIDSTISPLYLKKIVDTLHKNIFIAGSLDEDFAKNITDACYALKKYLPIILIGMPNWDGFKIFTKKDAYKDFPIHYTTPYYNAKTNWYNSILTAEYNTRYKTKPSDMAYRGFETAYLFTTLLMKYPTDFAAHLNDRSITIFNEFNFRPVYSQKKSNIPDYFENKHLYVMKILNGAISREW